LQGDLKPLLNELPEQPKESNEVALPCSVGADQHIQGAKFKVLQLPNGFEAFDCQLLDDFAHRVGVPTGLMIELLYLTP
jgi:hypothetical protein